MGDNVIESSDRGLVLETVHDHNKPVPSWAVEKCVPPGQLQRPTVGESAQKSETGPGFVPKGSQTHEYYKTDVDLPMKFDNPEWLRGYGGIPQHPLYRTSTNDYGKNAPNVHTSQTKFKGKSQEFTNKLALAGMYRDHGLNTSTDKTRVPE